MDSEERKKEKAGGARDKAHYSSFLLRPTCQLAYGGKNKEPHNYDECSQKENVAAACKRPQIHFHPTCPSHDSSPFFLLKKLALRWHVTPDFLCSTETSKQFLALWV